MQKSSDVIPALRPGGSRGGIRSRAALGAAARRKWDWGFDCRFLISFSDIFEPEIFDSFEIGSNLGASLDDVSMAGE